MLEMLVETYLLWLLSSPCAGDSGYMSPSSSTPSAEDSGAGVEAPSPVKEPLIEDA